MSFNLYTIVREPALSRPDHPVCHLEGQTMTYAELDVAAGRVAAALLQSGLSRGDRVVVQLANSFEFLAAYFGILRAGLTMVPVNPLLTQSEVDYQLADCGASRIINSADDPVFSYVDSEADVAPTNADDTAVIIYTSGTTGRPKGAELTHFQLYLNCTIAGEAFGVRESDVSIAALPFFHIYGLSSLVNCAIRFGTTLAAVRRFDAADVLDVMARHRVTTFVGVPTMYYALLQADTGDRDLSAFRVASSGGAAMPEAILTAFEAKFGATILEGYGMSETAATATLNRPDGRKPLSVGLPVWGVEVKLVGADGDTVEPGAVGEIWLRGHIVMKGYYGRPSPLHDGWLPTGDLAYQDGDGFLFIVDRLKDLIIRGGFNVYPREVEEVLFGHPAIGEAAVIGKPDERLGEEIVAVVSAKPGATIDPDELIAYCRERLAAYKCPREIRVLDSLPKNATGKLLKRELRG